MLITSMDLSGGKVVQLEQGKKKVIERDNIDDLISEFAPLGPVAVIDIDAAVGTGSNRDLVKRIALRGEVRAGGGVRTPEDAMELVEAGVEKVIIGSALFQGGCFNGDALKKIARAVGRKRIIVAMDTFRGDVMTSGWTKRTGLRINRELLKKVEQNAWGILVTTVEREGLMKGGDLNNIKTVMKNTILPVTAAGGISSCDEIAAFTKAGADVQLGMSIYTGRISTAEAFASAVKYAENGLIPVVAEQESGGMIMSAYSNREALLKTLDTGKLTFWSRSRQRLWTKGETSGNYLDFVSFRADCDSDVLRAAVRPRGPVCHTGDDTCFGDKRFTLETLYDVIGERFENPRPGSYTATLDYGMVREKILEEAREVVEAATRDEKIWEAADVLYFLTVLLRREDISFRDVLDELKRRNRRRRCSR